MVAVGGVPVPVMRKVDVIPMRQPFVPAARPVHVTVLRVSQVRQRMLVVMPVMWRVRVAIVDVVGVALALGTGMPAARSVLMLRMNVRRVICGSHGSSLL